jgi:hypothetical protein
MAARGNLRSACTALKRGMTAPWNLSIKPFALGTYGGDSSCLMPLMPHQSTSAVEVNSPPRSVRSVCTTLLQVRSRSMSSFRYLVASLFCCNENAHACQLRESVTLRMHTPPLPVGKDKSAWMKSPGLGLLSPGSSVHGTILAFPAAHPLQWAIVRGP